MRAAILTSFVLLLAACQSARTIPVRWSATLLELPANANLAAEYNRPFEEPVEVRRGGERSAATGCASAVGLLRDGFEPPTNVDYLYLKNAALHCLIFESIQAAMPSQVSYLADFHLDAGALPLLPAGLELEAPAEADGDDALVVHGPSFEQRLEVLARGDFDGDGIEDWLVREESWATHGTSREVRAFLLARKQAGAPLVIIRELAA